MAELVFELGCEELPAVFVADASRDLSRLLTAAFAEHQLSHGTIHSYSTPRRLIVTVSELPEKQPDTEKEVRGPAVKAAFDAEGKPTPALLGFCRGQGVDPDSVRQVDTYTWITKHIAGRPTAEVLAEILPQTIRSLTFPKSMRWGSGRMRFARPIRWIVALLDGAPVAFEIEGVSSGNLSRGHRFYAPEAFAVTSCEQFLAELRNRKVEPDPALRQSQIEEQLQKTESGSAVVDPALLEENVFLTEWPTVVEGTFPVEMLTLPEPVLITAMAKHERMFPVRATDGKLSNRFLFVRNSGEDDTVRKGCAWVLNARFNDAQFFYEQDQKSNLSDFLEATQTIVFQEKLGTVRSRADRLAGLSKFIAEVTGASGEEVQFAERAGLYAKADLATGLVSELSSLQGIIGAEYAARENFDVAVVEALRYQYAPHRAVNPAESVADRTVLRLAIADQLDKLAGYLGLGLEPTGSSDPFGLRRAVTVLIEAANVWPGAIPPFDQLFDFALELYRQQGTPLDDRGAHVALWDIFEGRYRALNPNVAHDVLEAAMLSPHRWELTAPQQVAFRIELASYFKEKVGFVQMATRPLNLVASAKKKDIAYGFNDPLGEIEPAALDSDLGASLLKLLKDQQDALFIAVRERKREEVIRLLEALEVPTNAFLDGTMVLVEDEKVRYARLTLLHAVSLQLLHAGDFTKLVLEG